MNLTQWILIFMIAICMTLTEQSDSETSERSSSEKLTCSDWILEEGFRDSDFTFNYNLAEQNFPIEDKARNIWTTAYVKALRVGKITLLPNELCTAYMSFYPMEYITPDITRMTCANWITLYGYDDMFETEGDNPKRRNRTKEKKRTEIGNKNLETARKQNRNGLDLYLSNCAQMYVYNLLTATYTKTPTNYCSILRIPENALVTFDNCSVLPDSQAPTNYGSNLRIPENAPVIFDNSSVLPDSGSTSEQLNCTGWILKDGFDDMDIAFNYNLAQQEFSIQDQTLNIWTLAYTKALILGSDVICPSDLCRAYLSFDPIENMTPATTMKTCTDWIRLYGYHDLSNTDEEFIILRKKKVNKALAQEQHASKLDIYLASCAYGYALHLLIAMDMDIPTLFCSKLGIPPNALVTFYNCSAPQDDN